jgi:hypothetical protein
VLKHNSVIEITMQNINDPVSRSTVSGPVAQDKPASGKKPSTPKIQFTLIESEGKRPLSKTLTLKNGELQKKLSPPMAAGEFQTVYLDSLDEFINLIQDRDVCGPHRICVYGVRPDGCEDKGIVATEKAVKEGKADPKAIARTKENFPYQAAPAIMLIDIDAPEGVSISPQQADQALCEAVPWWKDVRRAYTQSTSSNIYRKSDGTLVSTKNGLHAYIAVDDGTKIPELGNEIFIGLVEAGYCGPWVSESGVVQVRAWADRAVYKSNHPDFAFGPNIPKGQDLEQRSKPVFFGGAPMLVTAGLGRDDYDEWYRTSDVVKKILNSPAAQEERDAKREAWFKKQAERATQHAAKAGLDTSRIAETYNLALTQGVSGSYRLYEDFMLYGPHGPFTVRDALDDPAKYDKMKIDNPFEPGTDRNKTMLFTLSQTHGPAINCHAHGGMTFRLLRDTATDLDGLARPSWLSDDGDIDREALKASREATEATAEGAEEAGGGAGNDTSQTTVGGGQGTQTAANGNGAQGDFVVPCWMPEETAMAQINQVYGFTPDWGGRGTFFRINADGVADPCRREDVQNALANRRVKKEDGSFVPAFDHWNRNSQRREPAKVVYAPNKGDTDAKGRPILNLWRGFARTARRGQCIMMLQHIRNIACGGDRQCFRYLMQWMAHVVQKPDEAAGVVVVLRGDEEGAGKTIIGFWLCEMLGDHGLMLNSPEQLIGKFNAHLETRSLVVVNEPSWAGDKDVAAKLKSMVTEPTLTVERKYGGVYSVRNNLHMMFTTNARWAVPAGARARRYFVLDIPKTRVGDHAYFTRLRAEADNGGIEALMHVLLNIKLDNFNVRDFPITEALREQQERSLSLEAEWALDLVDRHDSGLQPHPLMGGWVDSRKLYDDYVEYAQKRKGHHLPSNVFGRFLGKVGVQENRKHVGRGWDMPKAADFAKAIREDAGIHD